MNWTGGRLHRHSHTKRGMLEKVQKQHFAKARIKRQHARPETPRRMPFPEEGKTSENISGERSGSVLAKDQERGKRRQRPLEILDSLASMLTYFQVSSLFGSPYDL